jgi:hypothetical protein
MSKKYDDIDSEKYETLKNMSYQMAKELFEDGFSKDSIYTFLHIVVGIGLYCAECDFALKGE